MLAEIPSASPQDELIDLNSVSEIDSGYIQEAARRLGSRCTRFFIPFARHTRSQFFEYRGVFRLPLGLVRLCPILCPVPTQMELD